MLNWCFPSDVVQCVWTLNADVNDATSTISSSTIDEVIVEATSIVHGMVSPNYSIETIDAYGGSDIPIVIRNLTKIVAARILLTRQGLDAEARNNSLIAMMNEQYDANSRIIAEGILRDNLGELVTTETQSLFYQPVFNNKFQEVLFPNDQSRTY